MVSTFFGLAALLTVALAAPQLNGDNIVGERDTTIKEHPYHVSIRLRGRHICSGAIVTKWNVVTARSCVGFDNEGEYSIAAGSTYWDATNVQTRTVVDVRYQFDSSFIDIVGLKLNEHLVFDATVQPLKRPQSDYAVDYNSLATVTGWSKENGKPLREVSLQFITSKKCKELYGSRRRIASKHICTSRQGAAELQVGSALVDKSGVLVGIARGDHVGNRTQDPFVFEYVPFSADWIRDFEG